MTTPTKPPFTRSFRFNLLMVLVVCAALYTLIFLSLGWVTKHGSEVPVPKTVGRDVRLAVSDLKRAGFDVEIDSSYDPTKKPLVVLAQQPGEGSIVKSGRTLFLTINKVEPPATAMPNLVNLSFRSATLILQSNRLVLGDTTYRPDIAEGAVLEQRYNGRVIAPGTMLPQGSRIDLVIGDGLGNTELPVPDVIGMMPDEAVAMLAGLGLQYTLVYDGPVMDSATAVVYSMTPAPINEVGVTNTIREGDIVDLRVKQSPTPEELERNRNLSLDVLGDAPDAPAPVPTPRAQSPIPSTATPRATPSPATTPAPRPKPRPRPTPPAGNNDDGLTPEERF